MFSSLKMRLFLAIYTFVLISIPIASYLVSQQTVYKSRAQEPKKTTLKTSPTPSASPAKQKASPSPSPTSTPSSDLEDETTIPTSFGPTLSLKVNFEGRAQDHSGKLFVGIVEGIIKLNPKFLLSFTIDLSPLGEYTGLSLAGLTPGQTYSALLKGSAQIASSSAFVMSPTVTNLNNGEAINLLSGDLNEDNTVNSSDYSIAQKAMGTTSKSSNWKENADFNKDGIINSLDLAFVIKNFGKIGSSGAWTSPVATSSGTPTPQGGYWIWVPRLGM